MQKVFLSLGEKLDLVGFCLINFATKEKMNHKAQYDNECLCSLGVLQETQGNGFINALMNVLAINATLEPGGTVMILKKKAFAELWHDVVKSLSTQSTHPISISTNTIKQFYYEPDRGRYYIVGSDAVVVYFTRREVDTLRYLVDGGTVKEVAQKMDLSPRTVEFYVKNLRQKLGCSTKRCLIEWVSKMGFAEKQT